MKTIKSTWSFFFFLFLPFLAAAQNKPVVKLELPVGIETGFFEFKFFLPTLYVPVNQHLDLGLSYNTRKIKYVGYDNGTGAFHGMVRHRFGSFYLKLNASNIHRRINPFFSYILSAVSGTHQPGEGDRYTANYTGFSMTAQEKATLDARLKKTQWAHGAQLGLEVKLSRAFSAFVKGTTFSITGDGFPYAYYSSEFFDAEYYYMMGGILIKLYGGNKSFTR